MIQRLRLTSKSVFLSVELVDYFQMTKTDEDYLTKFDLPATKVKGKISEKRGLCVSERRQCLD